MNRRRLREDLNPRPGEVTYVISPFAERPIRFAEAKAEAMDKGTSPILTGPRDLEAETLATFVVDTDGVLIKSRGGPTGMIVGQS